MAKHQSQLTVEQILQKLDEQVRSLAPEDLRGWIESCESPHFIVIDVRDKDYKYFRIAGAVHYASKGFGDGACEELIDSYGVRCKFVFHCMRSVNRGPRCAKRFLRHCAMNEDLKVLPEVYILQGGFKQWFRQYEDTSSLLEAI